jgi:hypothetical protein
VLKAIAIKITSDDLARLADAECAGATSVRGGLWIIEGGVNPAAIEEAVAAAGVPVRPDDLAHIVDARSNGARGSQWIVEGGVGVDRHDTGSVVIVSL